MDCNDFQLFPQSSCTSRKYGTIIVNQTEFDSFPLGSSAGHLFAKQCRKAMYTAPRATLRYRLCCVRWSFVGTEGMQLRTKMVEINVITTTLLILNDNSEQ